MAKKYHWLKLKDDFFAEKLIKKLRRLPGGDIYTIIYLKLLLASLKTNGAIEIDDVEERVEEELALIIDEDPDAIKMTLLFCKKNGLIADLKNGDLMMTVVPLLVGSETAGAERVRRHREKKKMLQSNADELQSNTDVTQVKHLGNVEIEKSKRRYREEIEPQPPMSNTSIEIENSKYGGGADDSFSLMAYEYQKLGFGQISGTVAEYIKADIDEFGFEWCKAALKESALQNAHSWKYAQAILRRWAKEYAPVAKPWEVENEKNKYVRNCGQRSEEQNIKDLPTDRW